MVKETDVKIVATKYMPVYATENSSGMDFVATIFTSVSFTILFTIY